MKPTATVFRDMHLETEWGPSLREALSLWLAFGTVGLTTGLQFFDAFQGSTNFVLGFHANDDWVEAPFIGVDSRGLKKRRTNVLNLA